MEGSGSFISEEYPETYLGLTVTPKIDMGFCNGDDSKNADYSYNKQLSKCSLMSCSTGIEQTGQEITGVVSEVVSTFSMILALLIRNFFLIDAVTT